MTEFSQLPNQEQNRMEFIAQEFNIAGHKLLLNLPADLDSILNAAVAGECVDPYWGKLWDSATETASCILQTEWPPATRALELGCGAGLAGIAGLLAGLDVTFSDHEPMAVELALRNAKTNGYVDCQGMVLDWSEPVERHFDARQFDVLLASDVLYEEASHADLLVLANAMLGQGGQFCIGDPGRQLAKGFIQLATNEGWRIRIFGNDMKPALAPFSNCYQWLVLTRELAH